MPRFISLAILLLLTVVSCVTPARAQADAPATIETITRKLASAEFAGRAGQTDGGRNASLSLSARITTVLAERLSVQWTTLRVLR